MEIQEESCMLSSRSICGSDDQMYVDVRPSSLKALQKKEAVSSVYEHEIKVRKPYTISKQRERWTKEEHDKFLEALKLYGRAWRQIEEHIGTKTAVQIRSHAQKFFSKVAREPSYDGPGTVKAIEIPPPRPKRKPMHPYPRKLVQSPSLKMPALEQPEWSSLSFPSVSDQENRSPTSVLTAFRSDTMGSSVSTLPSTCASPVSSPAGSNPVGFLLSGKENGCKFSIVSAEEDRSPSSVSTDVTMREKSYTEVKLGSDKDDILKEDQSMDVQGSSFKLFGRTVLLNDYQKPFCFNDGSLFRCPKLSAMDMDCHIQVQPVHHIAADGVFPLALGESQCGPSPVREPPMFFCLPSNEDSISTTTGANVWPLPWRWAFWGNMPAPVGNPDTTKYREDLWKSCAGTTDKKDNRQESSWTGSNTASNGDVVDSQSVEHVKEPALPSLRRSANSAFSSVKANPTKIASSAFSSVKANPTKIASSAFSSVKANPTKIARGFQPYKRCLVENEIRHPLATGEDIDGLQLCL